MAMTTLLDSDLHQQEEHFPSSPCRPKRFHPCKVLCHNKGSKCQGVLERPSSLTLYQRKSCVSPQE
eukprot:c33460_g1_i1 orf=3-197(-)